MQLAQNLSWSRKAKTPSPHLVVHFHGGGFIAQFSPSPSFLTQPNVLTKTLSPKQVLGSL